MIFTFARAKKKDMALYDTAERARLPHGALLACVLGLFLLASSSLAADVEQAAWVQVKSKSGVSVEQRDVVNSKFKATRGTLLSNARLFDLLAVLRDVDACKDWLHKCKHGEVVSELSAGESIYYTVIDSPFVLKDRDTVVRSTIEYDAREESLHIDMLGVEDARPLHKKRVRVLDFTGSWLLEPRGPEQIQLTYEVHMDPQVSTVGAANSTLATSVLETLVNVDRLAKRAPYVNTTVPAERLNAITRQPSSK